MKYEEPIMEIMQINKEDIVTTMSLGSNDFNIDGSKSIDFGSGN